MNPQLASLSVVGFVSALFLPSTGGKLFGLWVGIFFAAATWITDTAPAERYPGQYDPDRSTHP